MNPTPDRQIDKLERPACSLLLFLLFYLFFIPAFPPPYHDELYNIIANLIYFNLIFLVASRRREVFIAVVALITLEWLFYWMHWSILGNLASVLNIALFLIIIIKFLIQIARENKVCLTTILQSINGFLLLGMLTGVIVSLCVTLSPDAFFFPESALQAEGIIRMSEYLYFGLVTMTTLGFGEIVPTQPFARAMTSLIAVVGQLYIAVVIALLVGKFASSR